MQEKYERQMKKGVLDMLVIPTLQQAVNACAVMSSGNKPLRI